MQQLGLLALLIAYANMLLFDYRVDDITYTDYFIMLWMASFFVDETNQIIVAVIRGKWKSYSIDWDATENRRSIRLSDYVKIVFSCNIYSPMHTTTTSDLYDRVSRTKVSHQSENATDLECTHNKTIYDRGILQRCPSDLGVYVTPYLKAFYGLLAVVLLLNLLIAMYSDTYTKVQQNANLSWLQMQIDLFEEYRIKTIFPIHLQLLALPGSILAILWFCYTYLRKKCEQKTPEHSMRNQDDNKTPKPPSINDHPAFVRVFLYDTNYDIRPETTDEAEMSGVYRACEDEGKIDLSDSDAITTLNRLKTIEDSFTSYDIEPTENDRRFLTSRDGENIKIKK
ncbi:unnamed protein product [Mytilus coruscus]|uniref:Uncharacterized protein n=1 Tax=Mytilus coruscus TaxID=42192 RepID=A0A6J8BNF9_MYTCO|nr:unnamed protein product [Mytilus coruscus]